MTARTEYALQDLTDPCPDEAVATEAEASAPIRTMRNLIARTDDRTTQRLAAGNFLEGPLSQKSRKATRTTASSTRPAKPVSGCFTIACTCSCACRSLGRSVPACHRRTRHRARARQLDGADERNAPVAVACTGCRLRTVRRFRREPAWIQAQRRHAVERSGRAGQSAARHGHRALEGRNGSAAGVHRRCPSRSKLWPVDTALRSWTPRQFGAAIKS